MKPDDSSFNSINISSGMGSTTRIPILFPDDYEVWALHFKGYMLGLEYNGSLICDAIIKEMFAHTSTRKVIKTQEE